MPTKNKSNRVNYASKLRAIRPFISFDYNLREPLTKAAKQKISIYYNEISELRKRPHQIYRPRRNDRLAAAQQLAQHERNLSGLKVAFVPTAGGGEKVKIKYNSKGKAYTVTDHVTTTPLIWKENIEEFLKEPKQYVEKVIKPVKAERFTIIAGKYEIPNGFDRSAIGDAVLRYTNRYNDASANNFAGKWLFGLRAHTFKDQTTRENYLHAKFANKKKHKQAAKKARRAK